jgi:hypothetical protein
MYTAVIDEHSIFEHNKTMNDKLTDICNHTDEKIFEVMIQILKVYNKKKSNLLDCKTDPDI